MSDKKISFGFSKIKKPSAIIQTSSSNHKQKETVELIQCLEGQTIKIIGKVEKVEEPLVIPMKNNTKTSAALAAMQALKDTIEGREDNDNDDNEKQQENIVNPKDAKTLEERAALEIINSLKTNSGDNESVNTLTLPLKAEDLPLNGAKESTIDDYDRIPIEQYGLAILRGMGYKEDENKKKGKKLDIDMATAVRPKGMGLGADKMIKPKQLLVQPGKDEILTIRKLASVKILLGKHKDMYGTLGIPKHVCLFDWQLSRYASPAIDILYFIFLCTDKPLRDQHFDHLIQAYHNSLREQLELLNADVNQLFPFTALLRQLKQFGKTVLGTAIFAIPMLCMERAEIPDMDEWTEKFKDAKAEDLKNMQLDLSQKSENAYKSRMSGVLRDMYKKGYF